MRWKLVGLIVLAGLPACQEGTAPNEGDGGVPLDRDSGVPLDGGDADAYVFMPGPGGDEGAICRSASALDIFDDKGAVSADRYRALAAAFSSKEAVGYRFGQAYAYYHPTPESLPTLYKPDDKVFMHGTNQPTSTYQIGGPWQSDPGGYNSTGGQVLYVADDPSQVGVDSIEFLSVAQNVVSEAPQLSWANYGDGRPDVGLNSMAATTAHGGPFSRPIAIARAMATETWQMDSVLVFQDGSVATTGTHSSGGNSNIVTQLPAGLVPTGVAVTTNSELALVTVWDTTNIRGGLAVFVLAGPESPGFWGDWSQQYPGIANGGLFSMVKYVGVIWLPDMLAPIAVSAAADVRGAMIGAPDRATLDLSDEPTRQRFASGDLSMRYAQAGFAVVMSRSEKKVAFVDLQPTFAWIKKNYFGTRADFDATRTMGPGANQWPYAFSVAPEAAPVVVKTLSMASCPTSVATTLNVFRPNNFVDPSDTDRQRDPAPGLLVHALVGTEDGQLHAFGLGGLADNRAADAAAIVETGAIEVGRNPTSISSLGASDQLFGHPLDYVVVSRGDKRVELLHGADTTGVLSKWKTLRDSTMVDPISVMDVTYFANRVPLFTVADYGGKQVINYRYDKIELPFYGNQSFGVGMSGTDDFERGGEYKTPGGVLFTSNANIP